MAKLLFTVHAFRRIRERGIDEQSVEEVINRGETIETYPDRRPLPSRLMFAMVAERAIHVVAADDPASGDTHVITAYEPDLGEWEADFKTRRTKP